MFLQVCPEAPIQNQAERRSRYSLPEEPEQVQEHRSCHKKTVGTVTKLTCNVGVTIDSKEGRVCNSCRESCPSLVLAL